MNIERGTHPETNETAFLENYPEALKIRGQRLLEVAKNIQDRE